MMITILGATGTVGEKITDLLIKRGEKVRLVARSADRLRPAVGRNAQAFAGDAADIEFLVTALRGSDAVFTLIPPNPTADNFIAYADRIGKSITRALEIAKIPYVVNLSSVGAELPAGTGPVVGLHRQEERLNRINGLNVVHMRAAFFMENQLMNVNLIRSKGITGSAIRGDLKFPMIATKDVAVFAADLLVKKDFAGSSVRYLLGERDISMIEATEIIGRKIGMPGLVYVMFPYDQAEKSMFAMGLSPDMARSYTEMSTSFNDGLVKNERRSSANTTTTSFEAFCDEVFVPAFSQKKAA